MTGFKADPFEDAFKLLLWLTSLVKDAKKRCKEATVNTLHIAKANEDVKDVHSVPIVEAKDE